MAIQIPNPGTGNGATGDNEFVLWTKTKDNFSDQTNAASRLVGIGAGKLPSYDDIMIAALASRPKMLGATDSLNNEVAGSYSHIPAAVNTVGKPEIDLGFTVSTKLNWTGGRIQQAIVSAGNTSGSLYMRTDSGSSFGTWAKHYNNKNTTLDGNGALKPSSPVLRVFSDCITGNDDGDAMAATYTKNGVGDYTITGTTGLRTDGWYVVIPNDMNGNPKVAITLDDTDGVITLRSYVRIFDMSTFKFVPDLEQPLDIPDGRWIDLRFNDLPIEDDTQTEV